MTSAGKERRVSYSVYIDAEQLDTLRRLSLETDVPIAVWIRRGIDLVLKNATTPTDGK